MSSLKIEERFSVQAPIERVWRFLLDPEQIAPCLPGAELLQIENERTFHGQMKVKVGPVTVAYQGTIELTQVDEAGRRVQMVGKGKEKGGAGSAKMTMESLLEPQADGSVAIAVTSDVELAGRIVRFGRGMIQSVSAQLFKQFAANVRQALEGDGAGGAASAPAASEPAEPDQTAAEPAASAAPEPAAAEGDAGEAAPASDAGGAAAAAEQDAPVTPAAAEAAQPATSAEPAPARASEPAAAARASEPAAPAASATPAAREAPAASAVRASEPAAAPRAAQAPQARTGRELAPRTAEPVRALPLLFRALWDVISGFFKRLLGRGR
jgi:hypothetical protein